MDHHTQDHDETRAGVPAERELIARSDATRTVQPGVLPAPNAAVPFLDNAASGGRAVDLLCLSHLRWDFVFQRPQHLLTRAARDRRVYFIEEPIPGTGPLAYEIEPRQNGVRRVVFRLPAGLDEAASMEAQKELLDLLIAEQGVGPHVLWYYTPMAIPFTRHLRPLATVYDCMDELSAFAGAPPALRAREADLMARADVVFTGGHSLYEAKRGLHPRVHAFPSSVDVAHFARARSPQPDPADQASIPRPRIGFFGVIDERMDLELVAGLATARPDWHFVFLGPVVKISADSLPTAPNLHYLGAKRYDDLPTYLAGWDVAMLPFARNDATRFISPTKTPEYLAAGCPVVSTSIRDVVRPYGQQGLARIADTVPEFVAAIEAVLAEDAGTRQARTDGFLSQMSWDRTWLQMRQLVDAVVGVRLAAERPRAIASNAAPPPV